MEKSFQFFDYNKYIKALFSDEDAKFIEFEALNSEYCYLDRKFMFSTNEITEEEESKYFELKELLFADIAIRPYDLLCITPIDIRHKKHSGLRGGEMNERK